ncbi:MAG: DUF362 domain-containing protein [Verrucomicrobiota bacterium]
MPGFRYITFAFCVSMILQISYRTHAQDLRPDQPANKPSASTPKPSSETIIVHAPSTLDRFTVNPASVKSAFNQGLLKYTKRASVEDAWKTMVQPGERIGIRVSTVGGKVTSTEPALVEAVIEGLQSAGISPQDIIVWDKYPHHMVSAGYNPKQTNDDWQCRSIVEGSGWDPKQFYFHEIVGQLIWGDHEFKGRLAILDPPPIEETEEKKEKEAPKQISNRSYLTKILTQEVDKIINIPSMTSHEDVGLFGCLSSLALGSIDNHRRFLSGTPAAAQAVAEILKKEPFTKKVILHIMDGLIVQYAGGPSFNPNHAISAGFLLIGNDPVAIDSWCVQQMEYRREENSVVPIAEKANHIKAAEAYGLGKEFRNSRIIRLDLP